MMATSLPPLLFASILPHFSILTVHLSMQSLGRLKPWCRRISWKSLFVKYLGTLGGIWGGPGGLCRADVVAAVDRGEQVLLSLLHPVNVPQAVDVQGVSRRRAAEVCQQLPGGLGEDHPTSGVVGEEGGAQHRHAILGQDRFDGGWVFIDLI